MSALLQTSLDGKRFHGRWTESLQHCITKNEFDSELRRINVELSRHMNRKSSTANLAYALPFVCIPFGILLIALSFQQEKWPFIIAGVVVGMSGLIGGVLFRSVLGLVLTLCGIILAIIPYADKTAWVCIFIGTILAIAGCIGLMAIALRHNNVLRSARILVVLLPISIVFFCVPLGNLEYPAVMICTGIVLIITGILGGIDAASRRSRQMAQCIEDLRIVIDQLNQRYANRLIWTLIERPNESRGKHNKTLEIVVEVDPNCPIKQNEDKTQKRNNDQPQYGQPPVINVIVNNDAAAAAAARHTVTPRNDIAVDMPQN